LRIDLQTHYMPRAWINSWSRRKQVPYIEERNGKPFVVYGQGVGHPVEEAMYDADRKLADMDAAGIDMAAVSLTISTLEEFDPDEAVEYAREANNQIAELGMAHPDRFLPLATLPMTVPDACIPELERCIIDLGMVGVQIFANCKGIDPDARSNWPIYERMVELGVPMIMHPSYPYLMDQRLGDYKLITQIGFMFDVCTAVARMIYSGLLDQFPDLRIVVPHLGAGLPFYAARLDYSSLHVQVGARNGIKKAPSEYIRNLYVDTVSLHEPALMMVYNYMGPERMLFATDYPVWNEKLAVASIEALPIPGPDKEKIFFENAIRFLKLNLSDRLRGSTSATQK